MNKSFSTAEQRWEGVGPYYAMFPSSFADDVIRKYTYCGDIVFDPFAGRGTSIYSAAKLDRIGIGIEINPVGWVYSKAKLKAAPLENVVNRIKRIQDHSTMFTSAANNLPIFYHYCFSLDIRRFLLACRFFLRWRESPVDWTAAAFVMIYLQGKTGQALSNQMRQTKSVSPAYAIKWWQDRDLTPPEINPAEFLEKRIRWRYEKGVPKVSSASTVLMGDSTKRITFLARRHLNQKVRLLFTSPPYYRITNYHYDQWLRLWLLGFLPAEYQSCGPNRGRFGNKDAYIKMLDYVFNKSANLLLKDGVVYVRTDNRDFTREVTISTLKKAFPTKSFQSIDRPFCGPTQTALFGDRGKKVGEVDLILQPN